MIPLSEDDFSRFLQALTFAAYKHRNQKRKDGNLPYINHPIDVVDLLWRVGGVREVDTLIAGLLHDTVEDTETTPEEIRESFGEAVLHLVEEVTDDKSLPDKIRKQKQIETAPHKSAGARQIKLADKINNVYSLGNMPPNWDQQRKRDYLDWTEKVVAGLRGHNPALEAYYDQQVAEAREKIG